MKSPLRCRRRAIRVPAVRSGMLLRRAQARGRRRMRMRVAASGAAVTARFPTAAGRTAALKYRITEPTKQEMQMCCDDKQRMRHAHVRAYREKIGAEQRAGERRRRPSLGQRLAQRLAESVARRWRRLRRCYGLSRQDYEA